MIGTVSQFNGIWGFIDGENGVKYFLHKNNLICSDEKIKNGLKVKFTFPAFHNNNKCPRAEKVELVFKNWTPTHETTAYWVPSLNPSRPFRCSSCGHIAQTALNNCPHCFLSIEKDTEDERYTKFIEYIVSSGKMTSDEFEEWVYKKNGFTD